MVQLFGTMESSTEEKSNVCLERGKHAGRVLHHLYLGYKGRV